MPPFSEQQAIVAFLDYETGKIDKLIEKQEELIALLEEKRQVVISHAVTKGIPAPEAGRPMKDSGVEWLGDIPEHWEVSRIKFNFINQDWQRIPLSASDRGNKQGEYPYYGASGIIDYVDDFIFSEANVLVGEDGANLITRSTPLAFVARGEYWVNNHAHILKTKDDLYDYWAELLK